MILVISNEDDFSTNIVLDWIHYQKRDFIRVNDTDKLKVKNFTIQHNTVDFMLYNDRVSFSYSSIDSIWYRRGMVDISISSLQSKVGDDSVKQIGNYLMGEYLHFNYAVLNMLYDKFTINKSYDNHTNKVSNLYLAAKAGLNVPSTIISNIPAEFREFSSNYDALITKAIFYGTFDDPEQVSIYTNTVDKSILENLSESMWFSQLQVKLKKAYELRIFYLHGDFYASAIFSQNDPKTETDFRKYNYEKPNRTPPYNVPEDIKEKLTVFMKRINMNCGSIDMVVTREKEYVFLEVNPIGQFQQVSLPCNYHLEEKIAQLLIDGRK